MSENKKIVLIEIPFTFVDKVICPLDQISIDTLKFATYFKNNGESVKIINMRSRKAFIWKERKAGYDEKIKLKTFICSKTQKYLVDELKEIVSHPKKIFLMCNCPNSPYLFDEDVVESIKKICDFVFPGVEVILCGSFVKNFPEFCKKISLKIENIDEFEIDNLRPQISCLKKEKYGLFELIKGCINSCSFCVTQNTRLKLLNIDEVIKSIKEQNTKYGIVDFYCWDPNILSSKNHFENFLDKLISEDLNIKIDFVHGFQPNLLDSNIISKLKKINIFGLTIPFETATVSSNKKIQKPYTIISSIKIMDYLRKINKNFKARNSFIIGYPNDDFRSIFRIQLSILNLKGMPLPFPIFYFPNTKDYKNNADLVKNKSFAELHGQLWPGIKSEDVQFYRELFVFLKSKSINEAIKRCDFLPADLKNFFYEELKVNEYFLKSCLESEDESVNSLEKIEKMIENSPEIITNSKKSKNLLYISSSPVDKKKSVSKILGDYFISKYKLKNSFITVDKIDLSDEKISLINSEYIEYINNNKEEFEVSQDTKKMISSSNKYIDLLEKSDEIILTVPMFTLSIPASLKSFFEIVSSNLFYRQNDKILSKKKIYCIITRDGFYGINQAYENTEFRGYNVQEKTIQAFFDFIGLGRNIRFFYCEGLFNNKNSQIAKTKEKINDYFNDSL